MPTTTTKRKTKAKAKAAKKRPPAGAYIMVRVSDEEHAELQAFARKAGYSFPAVWARTVLLAIARGQSPAPPKSEDSSPASD